MQWGVKKGLTHSYFGMVPLCKDSTCEWSRAQVSGYIGFDVQLREADISRRSRTLSEVI
jgi:hypothetical protein